jgi:Zn-dependent protease with chaperone function
VNLLTLQYLFAYIIINNPNEKELVMSPVRNGYVFDYVEVSSDYLIELLSNVLDQISTELDIDGLLSLGPVIEGRTNSGEAGEVTENGLIYLDSDKLEPLDNDVAMALVAHELAHAFCEHYIEEAPSDDKNAYEREADETAKSWGFDIDKFREVCGPATVQQKK